MKKLYAISFIVFLIFLIAGAAYLSSENSETTGESSGFVCPPCGCDQDHIVFKEAGTCPSCGMKLVAKKAGEEPAMDHQHVPDKKVAVLIFDGVQIIDFTGPYEVFGQANYDVFTVEKTGKTVVTAMDMTVEPKYSFANSPQPDIVVVPGGNVIQAQKDEEILNWIRQKASSADKVLSVCNGAYILARTGLLDGLEATTFAALIEGLQKIAPNTKVVSNKRFVDNGKIVTSAGLSSGLDSSLHIIAELKGLGRAQEIATNLEYNWDPEGKYVRAMLADRYLAGLNGTVRELPNSLHVLHKGTERIWEDRWQIGQGTSMDEIQTRIQSVLQRQSGIQIVKASDGRSEWTFQDAQNRSWRGTAEMKKDPDNSKQVLVTFRIELAARTASK